MNVWSGFLRFVTKKAQASFVHDTKFPQEARSRRWNVIRPQLTHGSFWKNASEKLEDFEITTYETYKESLERSYETGVSELTGQPIHFWAKTSGTTGYRKIFPMTEDYLKEFQMITPPQTAYLSRRFPKFLSKPFLFSVATKPSEKSPTGLDVGYISYLNYSRIPKFLSKHYALPLELFRDDETFMAWSAYYALATDLSAIAAITPAMLSALGTRILQQGTTLLPYLEGTNKIPEGLPAVKVSRSRLALIKSLLAKESFTFKELWPSLQFATCWKSSTCGLQLPELQKWLGPGVPIIEGAYCATEGWMTVPIDRTQNGTLLHPGSHIVEFLPEGASPKKENLKAAWDLESNQRYEIILTTSMGFVRYRLFDVVACRGFVNKSPIIEFVGKSASMVSIGQVRFSEDVLLNALDGLTLATPYIFGPSADGKALVCYSTREQNPATLSAIQKRLADLNPDYKEDLSTGLMNPLTSTTLPATHPLLNRPVHAQTKPKILTQAPP